MEKEMVFRFSESEWVEADSYKPIAELIKQLQKLKRKGITHITYTVRDDEIEIYHYTNRLETDEEFDNRINGAAKREAQYKENEYAQYLELKAKYEPEAKC